MVMPRPSMEFRDDSEQVDDEVPDVPEVVDEEAARREAMLRMAAAQKTLERRNRLWRLAEPEREAAKAAAKQAEGLAAREAPPQEITVHLQDTKPSRHPRATDMFRGLLGKT